MKIGDVGVSKISLENHFLRRIDGVRLRDASVIKGVWAGVPVRFMDQGPLKGSLLVEDDHSVVGGSSVILRPLETIFVPLPPSVSVYGKYYSRSRAGGSHKVARPVRNLSSSCKRGWWISVSEGDPYHVLTDWDGMSYISAFTNDIEKEIDDDSRIALQKE